MVTEYDEFTVRKIARVLKLLEKKYGLEGVALITIEGNRIASAESAVVNMDEFSGNAVVIAQAADKLLQRMGNGKINGTILRGEEGFIVIERVTDTIFLIASDKRAYKIGYTTNLLKKFAGRIARYLVKGKPRTPQPVAAPASRPKPRFIIKRPETKPITEVMKSAQLPKPHPASVPPAQPVAQPQQPVSQGVSQPKEEVTVIDAGTLVLEDLAASGNVEVSSSTEDPTNEEIIKELLEMGVNPEELKNIDITDDSS